MKITIEGSDHSASVTISDGSTIDELVVYLKGVLIAYGFHPENVDSVFAEEE